MMLDSNMENSIRLSSGLSHSSFTLWAFIVHMKVTHSVRFASPTVLYPAL